MEGSGVEVGTGSGAPKTSQVTNGVAEPPASVPQSPGGHVGGEAKAKDMGGLTGTVEKGLRERQAESSLDDSGDPHKALKRKRSKKKLKEHVERAGSTSGTGTLSPRSIGSDGLSPRDSLSPRSPRSGKALKRRKSKKKMLRSTSSKKMLAALASDDEAVRKEAKKAAKKAAKKEAKKAAKKEAKKEAKLAAQAEAARGDGKVEEKAVEEKDEAASPDAGEEPRRNPADALATTDAPTASADTQTPSASAVPAKSTSTGAQLQKSATEGTVQQPQQAGVLEAGTEEFDQAVAELMKAEEEYNKKTEALRRQTLEGGVVSRNRAKNELAQHLANSPLPALRAKITCVRRTSSLNLKAMMKKAMEAEEEKALAARSAEGIKFVGSDDDAEEDDAEEEEEADEKQSTVRVASPVPSVGFADSTIASPAKPKKGSSASTLKKSDRKAALAAVAGLNSAGEMSPRGKPSVKLLAPVEASEVSPTFDTSEMSRGVEESTAPSEIDALSALLLAVDGDDLPAAVPDPEVGDLGFDEKDMLVAMQQLDGLATDACPTVDSPAEEEDGEEMESHVEERDAEAEADVNDDEDDSEDQWVPLKSASPIGLDLKNLKQEEEEEEEDMALSGSRSGVRPKKRKEAKTPRATKANISRSGLGVSIDGSPPLVPIDANVADIRVLEDVAGKETAPLGMCDFLVKCGSVMKKLRVRGHLQVQHAVQPILEIMLEAESDVAIMADDDAEFGLYYDPFSDENIEFQRQREAEGIEKRRGSMRFKQPRLRHGNLADAFSPPPSTPPVARKNGGGEDSAWQGAKANKGKLPTKTLLDKTKAHKRTSLAQKLGIQGRSISTASLWREYADIQETDEPLCKQVDDSQDFMVDSEAKDYYDSERNRASSTFDLSALITSALSNQNMVGLWLQSEKTFSAYNIPRGAVIDLKVDERRTLRKLAASKSYTKGTEFGGKMNYIRVYDENESYKTLYQPSKTPARVLCAELAEKFVIEEWDDYAIFMVKEGNETILGDDATPLELLEKMPMSEVDNVRFVFKDAGEDAMHNQAPARDQVPRDIRPLLKAVGNTGDLNLSFYTVFNYPEEFFAADNVTTFTFNSGKLTSMPPLTHFVGLRQLRLVKNDFKQIPEAILECVTLEELDMGNNVIACIPPSISKLVNLGELYLYVNQIQEVPKELGQMTQLRVLNLAHNFLQELPAECIATLTELNQLKLSGNFLRALPEEVCSLTKLSDLNVSRNQIREIPENVGELTSLQWFDAARNYISLIPESMGSLKELEELAVSHNRIKSIPASFPALELLLLDHNAMEELPSNFSIPNLLEVSFSDNKLTSIPDSLCLCTDLEKLELANNKLEHLPAAITRLKELTQLDVKHNLLKELPAGIGNMRVKVLDLSHNHLKELPADIWKNRSLWFLACAENQMLKFPACMSSSTPKVSDIYCGANFFDSSALSNLCALQNIRSLDMGYARIRSIPKEIAKLRRLQSLSLAGNRIRSLNPLLKLASLKELYVQNNNVTSLPSGLKVWGSLKIFDMSHNSISNISGLCKLEGLEWLDISFNPIKTVPEELAELPHLSVLQMLNVAPKKSVPQPLRKMCHLLGSESARFVVSAADMQGRRDSMEDAIVLKGALGGDTQQDLFCVFDGHGGKRVAEFGGRELTGRLLNEMAQKKNPVQCLRQSFSEVQEAISDTQSIGIMEGATAVAALFLKRKLYIANVGDTRAVLCRKGKAVRLSYDHKPELPEEEERIRSKGGFVADDNRVNAVLAVSRAFGDLALEKFVLCEPYVSETDLYKEDQFLIVACDGIWDVLSDQQACDIVTEAGKSSPTCAAAVLRDFAYMYGSMDNISAIVVYFSKACNFPKMT